MQVMRSAEIQKDSAAGGVQNYLEVWKGLSKAGVDGSKTVAQLLEQKLERSLTGRTMVELSLTMDITATGESARTPTVVLEL